MCSLVSRKFYGHSLVMAPGAPVHHPSPDEIHGFCWADVYDNDAYQHSQFDGYSSQIEADQCFSIADYVSRTRPGSKIYILSMYAPS